MPGLYGLTSNANISVYNTTGLYNVGNANVIVGNTSVNNTTGLYRGLGDAIILTNAQQLYSLLSESGNVNFALVNGNSQVQAFTANIGTTAGTYGSDVFVPVVTVSADGRVTAISQVAISGALGNYGNANVAAFLPHYGGTINAGTVFNDSGLALQGRDYAQMQFTNGVTPPQSEYDIGVGSWFYLDAGGGTFQSNTTGTLRTIVMTNSGNLEVGNNVIVTGNVSAAYFLGDGSQLINLPVGSTYSNANVAAYLPVYGGTILVDLVNFTNNSGVIEQGADRITITGNTQTVNTGVYLNDTGEASVFANGPVVLVSNTTGLINPTWTFDVSGNLTTPGNVTVTGNVRADYFLGDGSQLTNLPVQAGTYSNTNVAAYLSSNTDPTISNLNANAAVQAVQIDLLNANVTAANTNIQTLNANLGSYQTFANANVSNLQNQITGANTSIQTLSANLGAFETYANATFSTSTYSNANVAAYLPVYGKDILVGNISGNVGTNREINIRTFGNINFGSCNYITSNATIASTANINTTQYFQGDGSKLTNLPTQTGTYSNTNVAAYLASNTDATISNLNANSAVQAVAINTLNANVGAYEIWANAYVSNLQNQITGANTNIQSISANLGAYQTYANANAATQATSINSINANLGAYQTYANANAATQATSINSINANLGAFETYANLTFSTSTYSNTNVAAYLASNTDATISNLNANSAVQAVAINTLNANVGAYEIWANAYVSNLQNQITGANTNIQTLSANLGAFETYANATFGTSGYSNVNVAAYLPTYSGLLGGTLTNATQPNVSRIGNQYGTTTTYPLFVSTGSVVANANVITLNAGYLGSGPAGAGLITIQSANVTNPNPGTINILSYNINLGSTVAGFAAGSGAVNFTSDAFANGNIEIAQSNVVFNYKGLRTNLIDMNFAPGYPPGRINGNLIYLSGVGGSDIYWANGVSWSSTIVGNYGNANVAAYLPGYFGNIGVRTIRVTDLPGVGSFVWDNNNASYISTFSGNLNSVNIVTASNVRSTNGYFWANGTAYSTGGGSYGNTQVAAYLPTYTGALAYSSQTANVTYNNNYLQDTILTTTREKTANLGIIQGTVTVDANVAPIQSATVTANITFNTTNMTNFNTGQSVTLVLTQNTNANVRLLTSNLKYAGGSKILSSANAAIDTISITYDGTNYLASLVKGYA